MLRYCKSFLISLCFVCLLPLSAQAASPSLMAKGEHAMAYVSELVKNYHASDVVSRLSAEWKKENAGLFKALADFKGRDINIDQLLPKSDIPWNSLLKFLPDTDRMTKQVNMANDLVDGQGPITQEKLDQYQNQFYRKHAED